MCSITIVFLQIVLYKVSSGFVIVGNIIIHFVSTNTVLLIVSSAG
jgi:hypothetical protein